MLVFEFEGGSRLACRDSRAATRSRVPPSNTNTNTDSPTRSATVEGAAPPRRAQHHGVFPREGPAPPALAFVVLAPLPPQRRGVDAQDVRGVVHALGASQHAQDVLALERVQREV